LCPEDSLRSNPVSAQICTDRMRGFETRKLLRQIGFQHGDPSRASKRTGSGVGVRLRWQRCWSWLDFPRGGLLHAMTGLVVLNAIENLDASGISVDPDDVAGA
jgi:hypothetical protein